MMLKQAVRNVHKNMKSSRLNGAGIAVTTIAILFILSLSRGIERQVVRRNIAFETGAVTIKIAKEATGFKHKERGDSLFRHILEALDNCLPIKGYKPRISLRNALLYTRKENQRISLEGITKADRPLLGELFKILEKDSLPNGIIISKGLAEEAGLSLRDECHIALQTADGTMNVQDFFVSAVFLNTSQGNKYQIYADYEEVKNLYYANLPTRILIDLNRPDDVDKTAEYLSATLSGQDVEISTYKDGLSSAQALSRINKYGLLSMAFSLLFISFVGIWAMQTEQVNGRRKEVGTLLALGFSRHSVKQLFVLESLYTSLLFFSIGSAIILSVIGLINGVDGLYLGQSASFAFGSSVIKPELHLSDMAITSSIAFLYPLPATFISIQTINKTRIIQLLNQ
jgi:ABC-type lipoprotein release transport system permease subunit